MSAAVVDTSCLVALAFGEPGAPRLLTRLRRFDRLFASALVEAELLAAFRREGVEADIAEFAEDLALVSPDRPLGAELRRVTEAGYREAPACGTSRVRCSSVPTRASSRV